MKYYDALTMPDFFLRYTLRRKRIFKKVFQHDYPIAFTIYILYYIYIYIYIYIYMYVCMPIYICLSVKYECFLQPSEI